MPTRRCVRGISCGASCINANLECRNGLSGQSAKTADKLTNLVSVATKKTGFTPNPKKPNAGEPGNPVDEGHQVVINSKYKDINIKSRTSKLADAWSIDFLVDGEYDASDRKDLDKRDRLAIAKLVRYDVERLLNLVPDGARLMQSPHMDDGKGNRRASIYERFGFSPVTDFGIQFAIKQDGIISPYDPTQGN